MKIRPRGVVSTYEVNGHLGQGTHSDGIHYFSENKTDIRRWIVIALLTTTSIGAILAANPQIVTQLFPK